MHPKVFITGATGATGGSAMVELLQRNIGVRALVEVANYVDVIAERVVQLGGIANGTVRAPASLSRLDEYPDRISHGAEHIEAVAKTLSTFGRGTRMSIDESSVLEDADTADRGVDKWVWFVEALTQAAK